MCSLYLLIPRPVLHTASESRFYCCGGNGSYHGNNTDSRIDNRIRACRHRWSSARTITPASLCSSSTPDRGSTGVDALEARLDAVESPAGWTIISTAAFLWPKLPNIVPHKINLFGCLVARQHCLQVSHFANTLDPGHRQDGSIEAWMYRLKQHIGCII